MRHLKLFFVACLTIVSLGFITHSYAEDIPTTAPPTGIYDPHHYLNESVTQKLVGLNSIYQQTKLKPQLGIVIVPNIHGYSNDNLETTATKIANDWKIGYNDTKVGFLVLISVDTHDIYTLPSSNAKLAFDEQDIANLNRTIISDFRKQNYSQGLLNYLSSYQSLIQTNSNKTLDQIKKEKKETETKRKEATENTNVSFETIKALFQTRQGQKNVCMTTVKNKMQNLLAVITIMINGINSILKTKTLSIILPGQLPVVMITIAKIVSNVANTITKVQTN